MTDTAPLPALNGAMPAGYFAALGALTIAAHHQPGLTLSFDPTYAARLHGITQPDLIDLIANHATTQPPVPYWGKTSPQYPPIGEYQTLNHQLTALHPGIATAPHTPAAWANLADPSHPELRNKGTAKEHVAWSSTDLLAASGSATLNGTWNKTVAATNPGTLTEAFNGPWTYQPGIPGINLDAYGTTNAANHGSDKGDSPSPAGNQPAVTWLALNAFPYFPHLNNTTTAVRRYDHHRWLHYPLWHQPLGPRAIVILIDQTTTHIAHPDNPHAADALRRLNVHATVRCPRTQFGQANIESFHRPHTPTRIP